VTTTLEHAWSEVRAEAELLSAMSAFPIWTDDGSWITSEFAQNERGVLPHHGSWMVGDLPAILWFLATGGGDTDDSVTWSERALQWSERLTNRTGLTSFASVAHMFFRGTLVGLAAGHEERLRPLAMAAAKTVSKRFLEIGYMKSFGTPADTQYPFTTVDDVINLAVPLWYAQRTGQEELSDTALAAVHLIADQLVRPDGSTGQVLLFDPSGDPDGIDTYQGYSPDGCWSRGQAWGIYGFAAVHRLTGDPRSLEIADRMADYWIDRVQDEPAPLWDFDLPDDETPIRDTFAASLAYAGILALADQSSSSRSGELRSYATRMLEALSLKHVIGNPRGHGILSGAALDVPHSHGIGASVIVGDSYYTEALWRLRTTGENENSLPVFPQ
jgi:unsaturated chondroitin disaccharide hydrolase